MAATVLKSDKITVSAQDQAATVLGFPSPGAVSVQITGTLSLTMTFEATVDGTNWVAASMVPVGQQPAYATPVSTATAVGIWSVPTFGLAGFRARCSAYSSGSPVVTIRYAAQ
jgi:hypothetical protein